MGPRCAFHFLPSTQRSTGCSHRGFHFCPFSLRRACRPQRSPCTYVQREASASGALCQLPVWAPLSLTSSLPLSRCSPGPSPLPHLQAHLSYPSLCIGHQMGWSHQKGSGGCQGPSPRPLTAHSGVRLRIPSFGAETLKHGCHHQPGPLANTPPAFQTLPPPPFSLSLQDQATNY